MTEEQIKQNAETAYPGFEDLQAVYIEGAHSRDDEISIMQNALEIQARILRDMERNIQKLCNPWISVEERLPKPLTICAVWLKGDDLTPYISLYDSGCFLLVPVDVTVTHWMPIPELPKP